MPATLAALAVRHRVVREIRAWFDAEGFLELQAPCLVRGTAPDPWIASFEVGRHYLTTSTEYAIKRLMAAGAPRVYTLQSNFRAGDVGEHHNPEFTMLEWGRAGADLTRIEADLEAVMARAAIALNGAARAPGPRGVVDLTPPFERLPVAEAFARAFGRAPQRFDVGELAPLARAHLPHLPGSAADDAGALFTLLLDHLQQGLGHDRPVWLTRWPAFLGSSVADRADGVVERSELFVRGLELSDGFPFARDPVAQRARFAQANEERRAAGLPTVELDERYLAELADLPSGAGMAVGVERLLMALTGATRIDAVMAFPWSAL